jgi:hypothetical protein
MKPEIPSWGRPGRRARREISREVANEYLRSLKGPRENEHGEFVPHPVAWGVGIIGIAIGIVVYIFAPKLSNDTAGHSYLIGGLVALYGCFVLFLVKVGWFPNGWGKRIGVFFVLLCLTALLGRLAWPTTLFVSPSQVKFGGSYAKNQVFPFKVENKSDEDVYSAEFYFAVDDPSITPNDLKINVPRESRKPLGEESRGAEHFADISGAFCLNENRQTVFVIWVQQLLAKETRQITVMQTGAKEFSISSHASVFTTEPSPVTQEEKRVVARTYPQAPVNPLSCRGFYFLADDKGAPMQWFDRSTVRPY